MKNKVNRKFPRLRHANVTKSQLDARAEYSVSKGYSVQKWIQFCRSMMDEGFRVNVYEAQTTFSKYIVITDPKGHRKFKVRFSNHRPNKRAESEEDSDFYVGVANNKTTTTEQAITATLSHMNGQ
jgi:hypothetical protein